MKRALPSTKYHMVLVVLTTSNKEIMYESVCDGGCQDIICLIPISAMQHIRE